MDCGCRVLRLAESLELTWDDETKLRVDLQPNELPMLRIPAELEKGNQDRLLPMAPEFSEFLEATPVDQRKGFVFTLKARRVKGTTIGTGANRTERLLVSASWRESKLNRDGDGNAKKFASAHDLRRSFGERWASRLMPQDLMELMRHESIETTLRFYVGRNAQSTAARLWQAHRQATVTIEQQSNPNPELSARLRIGLDYRFVQTNA